jgi:hypothetical protein
MLRFHASYGKYTCICSFLKCSSCMKDDKMHLWKVVSRYLIAFAFSASVYANELMYEHGLETWAVSSLPRQVCYCWHVGSSAAVLEGVPGNASLPATKRRCLSMRPRRAAELWKMNCTNPMALLFEEWSEFLATEPELRVRFPALPEFLRHIGSGTGSTQPLEYKWGATWRKK